MTLALALFVFGGALLVGYFMLGVYALERWYAREYLPRRQAQRQAAQDAA